MHIYLLENWVRWWQLMAYFNRAKKKELDLKRINCLWGNTTREPESCAPQVLEQVATENEKGTDPRYFQNRWKEQSDRNFRNTAFRKGVTAWFGISDGLNKELGGRRGTCSFTLQAPEQRSQQWQRKGKQKVCLLLLITGRAHKGGVHHI